MNAEKNQVSIFSTFETLIEQAEANFLKGELDHAIGQFKEYAKITGTTRWLDLSRELETMVSSMREKDFSLPERYYDEWLKWHAALRKNEVHRYSFGLIEKILATRFLESKETVAFDLPTGIFCFALERYEHAVQNLDDVLRRDPKSVLARFYLSRSHFALNNRDESAGYLSQTLFLSGNELFVEDIDDEKIRSLYGRLNELHGKSEVGVWLAPFEAWFRNWLVFNEDSQFFTVMQHIERNERIMQVKYYTSEKYRHFIRCLYISEYARLHLKKERGIIWEQEAYMEKLDKKLFERYRKKRKAVV